MDILEYIKLDDITPDPNQPRKDFEPGMLDELASSIAAVGIVQAIRVRRNLYAGSGQPAFMIIAGERRWRASQQAGLTMIPAVIVEDAAALTDESIFAQQLTENLHNQGLNPVEKAEFINGRIEHLKAQGVPNAIERVAQELGVSPSWISKSTAILKYEPEIRALARDGRLRDYSLLKKISELRPEKKKRAIELIESGEFNGKEFFTKKRYDRKVEGNYIGDLKDTPPVSLAKQGGVEGEISAVIRLNLSQSDMIKLIDKTDYASMLHRTDPDWRKANSAVMRGYVSKFKEWILETE